MKRKWRLFTVFMLLFMLSGCQNHSVNEQEVASIKIVTTFYPMYDFTKNIMGSFRNVQMLIPAGVEPHDFEPSAKDIANITDAAVLIYNSDYFETWIPKVKKNIDLKQTEIINATQGIKLMESAKESGEYQKTFDPHIWLSPKLAMKEVANIRDGLIKKFPHKKALLNKNAQKYLKKLMKLDDDYQTAFKDTTHHKKFVTQHKAFSYLAKDYGLEQIAIAGLSPEEEVSPARLAELKKRCKKDDIRIIYFEETASSKLAQTLAKEVGVETAVLNPLESLTKTEQKAGKDYFSIMEENLKALKLTIK
ncbi:MAG: metal ABC transporter substrate-binding protein [Lactobacillales bacterium]|jgi:zinc transport system substrate-binding protein|nr:metal ABC transporter substrate-binding protein [Lactobacillales bacterium]